MREGDPGESIFVVLRGEAGVRKGDAEIASLGAGEHFGEMALVDRTPRLASAVAESDCELLAINRNVFLELVKHSRRFAASLLSAVSERARFMASR